MFLRIDITKSDFNLLLMTNHEPNDLNQSILNPLRERESPFPFRVIPRLKMPGSQGLKKKRVLDTL